MYEIISKRLLNSHEIYRMEIHAPWISLSGKPGQFVIVIPHEQGERIPLTISDIVYQRQSIVIVFQVVGETTRQLAQMNEGEDLYTIVGPLGRPSELIALWESQSDKATESTQPLSHLATQPLKRLLFVAGGVGIAPVFPQVKWAFRQGIPTDVIIGARSKDLLFYEDELRAVCHNLHIMTDDGSYGEQGLVTAKVDELCTKGVEQGCGIQPLRGHRAAADDEVRQPDDEEVQPADHREPELHDGGRHGYVRCLPREGRRPGEVLLRGRPGVRRPPGGLR